MGTKSKALQYHFQLLTLLATATTWMLKFCNSVFYNYFSPSQISWWPRDLRQVIPVQGFHNLSQAFMAVILLVPHILVVFHLPFRVQSQRNEAVNRLCEIDYSGCILLLHFEYELCIGA